MTFNCILYLLYGVRELFINIPGSVQFKTGDTVHHLSRSRFTSLNDSLPYSRWMFPESPKYNNDKELNCFSFHGLSFVDNFVLTPVK